MSQSAAQTPTTQAPATMLAARDVAVRYPGGHEALRGVSLEVARGETLALVGESGSGKTTLLRCFNRLVEPERGEVSVRGEAVRAQDPVQLRRHVGYVQQDGGLLPHWTVERNVALVPSLQGWDPARIASRVREALALVGLAFESFADRYPRRLSGGQRQRIALARAFLKNPPILLLDEATSAVDNETEAAIQRSLARVSTNRTTLVIAHRLSTVRHAHLIHVLDGGRITESGTHDQLVQLGGVYAALWAVQTGEAFSELLKDLDQL